MNTTCTPSTCAPAANPSVDAFRKPLYNVNGNAEAYEVRVEMPGVPKTGVKLDLEDNILTIRGERASSQPEGMKTLHRELSPLNYLLRLRLNTPVDEEKLTAKLEDGVLSIQLPLKATAKSRTIAIN